MTTLPTSPSRTELVAVGCSSSGTSASSRGVWIACTCTTCRRWLGVSRKPPAPTTEPVENCSAPESSASEVVRSTSSSVTWRAAILAGSA